MGNLTHTVSGDIASFRSAARVPIESLKCHFLPVQEGSGDPSPENVRPISGWQGCNIYKTGKNIGHIFGYSSSTINSITSSRSLTGGYGNTINTIYHTLSDPTVTITQTQWFNDINKDSYKNGYFCVGLDNLIYDHSYDFSFKITNITNNPLNATLSNIRIQSPGSSTYHPTEIKDNILIFHNIPWQKHSNQTERCSFEIYNCGMSFTMSEFMVTPAGINDGVWEPYSNKNIVTWNQWLKPLTAENWQPYNTSNISVTFDNEIANTTWLNNQQGYLSSLRTKVGTLQSNKQVWYVSYMVKSSIGNTKWGVEYNGGLQVTCVDNIIANEWTQCSDADIYWKGNRNYVYINYYRAGADEHTGMQAQIKAPILINLTQMFGAGNEPTKEEFEAQCLLNGIDLTKALSYNEGTTIEWKTNGECLKYPIKFPILGKNKFNINATFSEPSNTNSDTTTKRIFQPNTYCVGLTNGNYYNPTQISEYSINNSTITFIGKYTGYGIAFALSLLPGTYTISYTSENITLRIGYYDKDGNRIYSSASTQTTFQVSREADITVVMFTTTTANTTSTISNIQIEDGITATTYEPYSLDNTVYGGYVDIANGEIVAEWISKSALWKDIRNNNPNINTGIESGFIYFDTPIVYTTAGANNTNSFCNVGKYAWAGTDYNMPHFYPGTRNGNTCSEIYLPSTVDENIIIQTVVKLQSSIHYPLSKTELKTFLDQNNIWSNTNDITEVSYAVHDSAMIRSTKKQIIGNEPHIETASGTIATFNTDIVAPLKECKIYFNPVQEGSGSSSLENIRSINGLQSIELNYTNKNLLGGEMLKNKIANLMSNISINSNNGIISYNNADAVNHQGEILYDKFKPNTRYTFIVTYSKNVNRYIHLRFDYSDGTHSMMSRSADITVTDKTTEAFVSTANKTVVSISRSADEYSTVNLYYNESGLFEGVLTTNQFELSNNQTIPINWANDIGTIYGGYVDLIKGELVETYKKLIIDNTCEIVVPNSENEPWAHRWSIRKWDTVNNRWLFQTNTNILYCDRVNKVTSAVQNGEIYGVTVEARIYLYDNEITTIEEFHNKYDGMELCAPVYVPTIYQLTPQQIKDIKGINNIQTNSNGSIEVKYWTH